MSLYRKGRRFEYEIKKILEKMRWTVFRIAASKPVDLVAFRNGDVKIIECKNYPQFRIADIEHCMKISRKTGRPVYLIRKLPTGLLIVTPVHATGKKRSKLFDQEFK